MPSYVLRHFAEEEPFRSQLFFLGYKIKVDKKRAKPRKERSTAPQCFDNGVPFVPILAELLESAPPEKRARWRNVFDTVSRDCFFRWANAAADEDPLGSGAIPRMTNLAVFVYKQRPDLQAAFPDIFDLNRLGYSAWFLRYADHRYDLDALF